MENHNTLKVTTGCFEVNGKPVDCVAGFKCEGFASGLARVTLTFDVPLERCMIGCESQNPPNVTYEHRCLFSSEPHGIRMPAEDIVFERISPLDENRLSRRELLELAKIGVEDKIRSAAALHMDKYFDKVLELSEKRRSIIVELAEITGEQRDGKA